MKIGGKLYTHDFVVSEDKRLSLQVIMGLDFMRKFNVNLITKLLKLYIEGERIIIAELPMKHALLMTEDKEIKHVISDSENSPNYECSVAQALVSQGMSKIVMYMNMYELYQKTKKKCC